MSVFSLSTLGVFTIQNIIGLFVGAVIGMLVGALPGLGQTIALTMCLPLTYTMEPVQAILMMLSCYQSSGYGGSISSVTLCIPGTPAAVATCLDGNPLSKKGNPGRALAYALVGSTFGGILSSLIIIFLAKPLAIAAMVLGEPEYFLICVFGLLLSVMVICKDLLMGLISLVVGMLAGTIGTDLQSSVKRFTFGRLELSNGLEIMAVLVGAFALTEIFKMAQNVKEPATKVSRSGMSTKMTVREFLASAPTMLAGGLTGTFIGVVPGLGGPTASWVGYACGRRLTRDKTPFGEGNVDGIAGPESANNGAVGGNLIPLLIFGLPSNAMIAIILGAFMIHGVSPGAKFFTDDPQLASYILFGLLLTSVVMYIVGRLLTPAFAAILTVPNRILFPVVLLLSLLGAFTSSRLFFNVWLAVALGVIFFALQKIDFSVASFVLAYVLGPSAENYLRRALRIHDSLTVFVTRPASLVLLIGIAACIFGTAFYRGRAYYRERQEKKAAAKEAEAAE